jgi:hypothetical protein
MNTYLVATQEGGVMECPKITYTNYQIVHAKSYQEAYEKYKERFKVTYWFPEVMASKINGVIKIYNKSVTFELIEKLEKQ